MANGKVREWIGPRIVPIFADDVEWDIDNTYEPLMMVQHEGETFMSRQYVPAGIQLPDTAGDEESNDYWVHMSNWNAQVEYYRQEVLAFDGRIDDLEAALPVTDFDATHTVDDRLDAIEGVLPLSDFDTTNTVDARFDTIEGVLPLSEFDSTNTVDARFDLIEGDIATIKKRITPYDFAGKKFVFIGDSITIGQSGTNPATFYEHPWCWTLCDIVGASYYNFAVGGACFQNAAVVTPENFDAQVTNVIASDWAEHEPDYIFIMLGTNDYGTNGTIGDMEAAGDNYTTVCGAMKKGIAALRTEFRKTNVIGIIPPFMPGDVTRNGAGFTALDYKTAIKNMYDILNVPTIDFTTALSANETNWNYRIWDSVTPRLHPNQQTHDFMGKIAAAAMPSVYNRMYSMVAKQGYGGRCDQEADTTGYVNWWIDEQNNLHLFTEAGVKKTNGASGNAVATVPDFCKPMFVYYAPAVDGNTGNSTYVYLNTNGKFVLGGVNILTFFHVCIPQMLRRTNTGNIRAV